MNLMDKAVRWRYKVILH